jgi:hypothetical protein
MSVWMLVAVWGGLVNLAIVLVNWRGRISYERARAASLMAVARATPAGGRIRDERPDGTVLQVEIPSLRAAREAPQSQGPASNGRQRC